MRKIVALAVLLLGATACTPEEVRFWTAYHAEKPAEAEAQLDELGLSDPARSPEVAEPDTPSAPESSAPVEPSGLSMSRPADNVTDLPHAASVSCPGTLTLTNTGPKPWRYAATYGPLQAPLVMLDPTTGSMPVLAAGDTAVIDIAVAVAGGSGLIPVFIDNALAFRVIGSC